MNGWVKKLVNQHNFLKVIFIILSTPFPPLALPFPSLFLSLVSQYLHFLFVCDNCSTYLSMYLFIILSFHSVYLSFLSRFHSIFHSIFLPSDTNDERRVLHSQSRDGWRRRCSFGGSGSAIRARTTARSTHHGKHRQSYLARLVALLSGRRGFKLWKRLFRVRQA